MHADPERVWREKGLRASVLAGDERAWQTWYDESFAGLEAYVRWRCGGRREAIEEVVQETWLTAVRRIRAFDPERGSFIDWLRGIAGGILRNYYRKARRRTTSRLAAQSLAMPEKSGEEADRAERIAVALAALPERYEAVLRAKYLDQESVEAIAAAWKETPKAIESLLSRARQAFRAAYQDRLDEPSTL